MRLSVQIEFDKTLDLETNKTSVVVGRSPQSDLVIPHDGISRSHCKIEIHKGMYYITDLGSSNGVFLDGQRLAPETRTAFLNSQQLRLGGLECEVNETKPKEIMEHKILSSSIAPGGDFTSTVRLARIDLNKPSQTLELEKKPKSSRPRNPVTAQEKEEIVIVRRSKLPIILITLLIIGLAWYFAPTK